MVLEGICNSNIRGGILVSLLCSCSFLPELLLCARVNGIHMVGWMSYTDQINISSHLPKDNVLSTKQVFTASSSAS